MTAHKFVRSFESRHGRVVLNALVGDVGSGAEVRDAGPLRLFEDSLRNRFGGTCTELYAGWLESW